MACGLSGHLRTPPNRPLPPSNPLSAPLGQVRTLRNQTLMDGTGQHRDAVPADLIAEVLAGDADGTAAPTGCEVRQLRLPRGHCRGFRDVQPPIPTELSVAPPAARCTLLLEELKAPGLTHRSLQVDCGAIRGYGVRCGWGVLGVLWRPLGAQEAIRPEAVTAAPEEPVYAKTA